MLYCPAFTTRLFCLEVHAQIVPKQMQYVCIYVPGTTLRLPYHTIALEPNLYICLLRPLLLETGVCSTKNAYHGTSLLVFLFVPETELHSSIYSLLCLDFRC